MFRAVSRKVLEDRQIEAIISGGPRATKYSPNFELTRKGITKSVFIGNEKEIEHKKQLQELYERIKPDTICSKGYDNCMNSVKRVQSLTKRFLKENWHKKSQREG